MSRPNFPQGPNTTSSLTRFSDIVVGYAEQGDDKLVMRIYGSLNNSEKITTKSLITSPGGAYLHDQILTNLNLPINPTDAANKEYVDAIANGLNIKTPAQVATVSNIVLSGVQTIDGYLTNVGDRVLVKNQTLPVENGLYVVSAGVWSRTADLPIGSAAAKTAVQIENGLINKNSIWVCTNTPPGDITGTDPLYFVLFYAGIVAGAGLSQIGNTFNVNVDNVGIEINGLNQLGIKLGGITNSDLQNSTITINTSNGISGGSVVSLGSSINLSTDSTVVRTFGLQTINGNKLFNDPIFLMNGINGVELAPPTLATSYTFTFPVDGGLFGEILTTDGTGTTSWTTAGSGDVIGPGSSTNNTIALFNGTTGKIIKNSVVTIDGSGNIVGVQNLNASNVNTTTLFINSESISGQRIFSGYDSIGGNTVTGAYQTLVINTNVVNDAGYINTLGVITISDVGTYDVFYHLQVQSVDNSGGKYCSVNARVEMDTGAGFNLVAGSGSSCFIIEQNGDLINPGTGKEVIIVVTVPNTLLRVTYVKNGTTAVSTRPGESSLIIKRLRP